MCRTSLTIVLLLGGTMFAGCETLHKAGVPGLEMYLKDPNAATAVERREQYQTNGDPVALNWLLVQRVRVGQSVAEVSGTLGEQGELYDDFRLKTHGGDYLATDVAYHWGPDASGRSIVLIFRDGKLVNFDPDEFRTK